MPQYQAGQTGTETLRAGSVLTVTLVAGTGATVARSIGGATLIREPALAATTSYGPYENDQAFQVCPFAGSTIDMTVVASPGAQLSDAQAAAAVALVSGGGNLTATLDGSGRLASLANVSTGRTLTLTYTDSTHLTIRDNGAPQAEVALVLDSSQRLVSATGNF